MPNPPRRSCLIVLALALSGADPCWAAQAPRPSLSRDGHAQEDRSPFRIDGRAPTLGYISTGADPIPEDLIGVELIARRAGLISLIEPHAYATLGRFTKPVDDGEVTDPTPDHPVYLHLAVDDEQRVYLITPYGDRVALTAMGEPRPRWSLRADVLEKLGLVLAAPSANPPGLGAVEGNEIELPQPHTPSPIVLDARTIRSRIGISYPPLTRIVGEETFRVRLPKGFAPTTHPGVLVWISPGPDGRIPGVFAPICDELGLIAIGVDDNGNKREITDRLQNHLDSIETLARRCAIDRDRVYVTGMSGGGRCSSILQLAFPDLFAGSIPILGLDSYHNALTGKGGEYWPRRMARPSGRYLKMLHERRIAGITGAADFNRAEMSVRKDLLAQDGIDMRLDIIEGMAHAMPSAEQFADALRWVDEPRRAAIEQQNTAVNAAFAEYTHTHGDAAPTTPAARRALIEIIETGPNSGAASHAAELLGYPLAP